MLQDLICQGSNDCNFRSRHPLGKQAHNPFPHPVQELAAQIFMNQLDLRPPSGQDGDVARKDT